MPQHLITRRTQQPAHKHRFVIMVNSQPFSAAGGPLANETLTILESVEFRIRATPYPVLTGHISVMLVYRLLLFHRYLTQIAVFLFLPVTFR
jgi:hypothetical protein